MSALENATHLCTDRPDFTAQIPDDWQQGRGAFGGVSMALMAHAALASEQDSTRTIRTFTADLCAPVLPGTVGVVAEHLRRGKRLTNVDVRVVQAGNVVARASVALGSHRVSALSTYQPPPPPPHPTVWSEVPLVPIEPPLGPVFARHFEYRSTGTLPFAGKETSSPSGFLRAKEVPKVLSAPLLIAMLDVWWPAFFGVTTKPHRAATITFTAEVHADPSQHDPQQPLRYRGSLHSISQGYTTEFRELWSGSTLLASNQQTMAII